jgi:nicotinamide-nucleotide amidase
VTAEIVSVGTELLLGQIVDTHAATMGRILAEAGLTCRRRSTVGDNFERLCAVLRESLERTDVLIAIGGLGPTMDDLTRDAIAEVLGDKLERDPGMEQELRELFARRKLRFTESILRQADKPESANFIENRNGTAPGLICRKNGKVVIALPGPKGEFEPMAKGPVKEHLQRLTGEVIHSVVVRLAGIGESHVEELVRPLMEADCPTVAPYAQPNGVHLRITARATSIEEARLQIDPVLDQLQLTLGPYIYSTDAQTLENAVIELLRSKEATVSVAESMTGGDLAARLSSEPGSGVVFPGGVTCYSIPAKKTFLGVSDQLITEHGPVSSEVARALAVNVMSLLNTTFGISVTGNAGPTSDLDAKPVGLVYIGLAGPSGVEVREHQFSVDRDEIRNRTVNMAMNWLRDEAMKLK